jgi:hypothetical protein
MSTKQTQVSLNMGDVQKEKEIQCKIPSIKEKSKDHMSDNNKNICKIGDNLKTDPSNSEIKNSIITKESIKMDEFTEQ